MTIVRWCQRSDSLNTGGGNSPKLPLTSPPLMLSVLSFLSFSWEGDWESTLLSLFTPDGSFYVQGHPTSSAPMFLFPRRGGSWLMDESLNTDGVSFVPGYEERLKGLISKEKSVISLLHLLLLGDNATRPKACPPLEFFICVEGDISILICQIPVFNYELFQNSNGE